MTRKGLGLILAPDPRNADHPMRATAGARKSRRQRRKWERGPILDQGERPECVGYGCSQFLMSAPMRTELPDPDAYSHELYATAQTLDPWRHEPHEGSTIEAGMQSLRARGHIAAFVHAENVGDVVAWLLTRGGVLLATPWREGMAEPDPEGYARATGADLGAHCTFARGVDLPGGYLWVVNSHGEEYGLGGECKLPLEDFEGLWRDGAQACAAVETKS